MKTVLLALVLPIMATSMSLGGSASGSSGWSDLKLQGIVTPLVTPLLDQDTLDREGTRRVLEHVIDGGVAGIFLLGTTGEGPSLHPRLRREFCTHSCEIVNQRVPVLVGITDPSFTETVQMARAAKEAGASAVVLTSPYYFPLEQADLLRYVKRVVQAVGDIPVLLYNMPAMTKIWFQIETLQELSKEPNIVGIKDSSGDLEYFEKVCQLKKLRPDWSIFMGPEHLTATAIRLGADGGVNGGSNVEPRLFVQLAQAALEGDDTKVTRLMQRVEAFQAIYAVGNPGFKYVVATKCAMSIRNLCTDVMAEPFAPYEPAERLQVQKVLDNLPQVLDE